MFCEKELILEHIILICDAPCFRYARKKVRILHFLLKKFQKTELLLRNLYLKTGSRSWYAPYGHESILRFSARNPSVSPTSATNSLDPTVTIFGELEKSPAHGTGGAVRNKIGDETIFGPYLQLPMAS